MLKFQPMDKWAVIKIQGKQYLVSEGDQIAVDKVGFQKDSHVTSDVLLLRNSGGIMIGKPQVANAKVKFRVMESFKGPKIRVVKFRPKSRYLRTRGHRQAKTRLLIEKIAS